MSVYQLLLSELRGPLGPAAIGVLLAIAVACIVVAASPRRSLQRLTAVAAAVTLVSAGLAAGRDGFRVPVVAVFYAAVVAATALSGLLARRLQPNTATEPHDGLVAIPRWRIVVVGLGPAAMSMTAAVYLSGGISRELFQFAAPDAPEFLATGLFALSSISVGLAGGYYVARSVRADPRKLALRLQLATAGVIASFVVLSQAVPPGTGRLLLLFACLALSGGCGGFVVLVLLQTVSKERFGETRAAGFYFAAWGSVMFLLAFTASKPLVKALGGVVPFLALGVVPALVVTAPWSLLLPRHPETGRARPPGEWKAVRGAFRQPMVRRVIAVFALGGGALVFVYSPMDVISDGWRERGAWLGGSAVALVGVAAVTAVVLQIWVGARARRNVRPMLTLGAVTVVAGYALGLVPLLEARLGGLVVIAQAFLVEFGTDVYLLLIPARLNRLGQVRAQAALAAFVLAKYLSSIVVFGLLWVTQLVLPSFEGRFGAIQFLGLAAGLGLLAFSARVARDLDDLEHASAPLPL